MPKKKKNNLIFLGETEGKKVFWDTETGVKNPQMVTKTNDMVERLTLKSFQEKYLGAKFDKYVNNVFFKI